MILYSWLKSPINITSNYNWLSNCHSINKRRNIHSLMTLCEHNVFFTSFKAPLLKCRHTLLCANRLSSNILHDPKNNELISSTPGHHNPDLPTYTPTSQFPVAIIINFRASVDFIFLNHLSQLLTVLTSPSIVRRNGLPPLLKKIGPTIHVRTGAS